MRFTWSRIPRVPLLLFLVALAAPAWWLRTAALANATGIAAVAGIVTIVVWNAERVWPKDITLEQWRERVGNRDATQGCTSISLLIAGLVPAWMFGWQLAGDMEFTVGFLQVLTAIAIASIHYLTVLMCFAFALETRPPAVPENLRAELAARPRALGVAGAGDAREIAPGFVADLDPNAPPAASVTLPSAPLRRVLRLPQAAPWKPANERRLALREWRAVLGIRFFLGLALVAVMIAAAAWLGTLRGGALAVMAACSVVAAAGARATRWDWPGEVSLADWFRSERSLVNTQQRLASLSNVLVIGSGIVIAGEAIWQNARGKHDLMCGAPLVMVGVSIALPLAWRYTLRRSIGQPPAVRSVPEPIRQAVLAVAKRREEVVTRDAESEEVSVTEDLGGVSVAPDRAEGPAAPEPPAPAAADGAVARESAERVLAELSRAASLRPDGAQLVRRVEVRLGQTSPQPDDTDLLVDVAELLFLAFPDRAAALVGALGDALTRSP